MAGNPQFISYIKEIKDQRWAILYIKEGKKAPGNFLFQRSEINALWICDIKDMASDYILLWWDHRWGIYPDRHGESSEWLHTKWNLIQRETTL